MSSGGDDRNSLQPVAEAALKSDRVKALLFYTLKWLLVAAVLPAGKWAATRYDTVSAAELQRQTNALEDEVGLPEPGVTSPKKLRDRVADIENGKSRLRQEQLKHDHDLLLIIVSASAGAGLTDGRKRDKVADAIRQYEATCLCRGTVGDGIDPYRCLREPSEAAAAVLGTP